MLHEQSSHYYAPGVGDALTIQTGCSTAVLKAALCIIKAAACFGKLSCGHMLHCYHVALSGPWSGAAPYLSVLMMR